MQTVRQLIEQWCAANQISVQAEENRLSFWVDGAHGRFPAAVLPLEEERAMVCLFGVGPFVPQAARPEAARQLAELNYPIKLGSVQLLSDTGELTYRMTQLLPDDDGEAAALVARTLLLSAGAMDGLLPALTRLCCL